MFQPNQRPGCHVGYQISPKKKHKLSRWLCFLSSFIEFCSVVSEKKSKESQPIRGQGGHLGFLIGPKYTNLVEYIKILLPVKFHWIPLSGFREVKRVSANWRPGRRSCFSDRPEKHKLGRGRWDLPSCQVSLNSVQRFQRRSRIRVVRRQRCSSGGNHH